VSLSRTFRNLYLSHLSKPAENRLLYRAVMKNQITSIVELGLEDGLRGSTLIRLALENASSSAEQEAEGESCGVRYTGIDLFEASPQGVEALSLKKAHRLLKTPGAQVKLIPGDPFSVMARSANTLLGTDLLTISADLDRDSLDRAWFYLPRMLHGQTMIFMQYFHGDGKERRYRQLSHAELNDLAGRSVKQAG